ncbi:MAG: hypothetical protein HYV93_19685 [Candidatus Rokubacteria bacterium]|nr:hypothetical protein [Candidatus Rokubacteria bacterium]
MQVLEEATIFHLWCDAAILEEAKHRLGIQRVAELLGVEENQFYVYRNRGHLPQGKRDALIVELAPIMAAGGDALSEMTKELYNIQATLNKLLSGKDKPLGSPSAAPHIAKGRRRGARQQ